MNTEKIFIIMAGVVILASIIGRYLTDNNKSESSKAELSLIKSYTAKEVETGTSLMIRGKAGYEKGAVVYVCGDSIISVATECPKAMLYEIVK